MIPGLDPITLSAGVILAGLTTADCPAQKDVDVEVKFVRTNVDPVSDKTAAELTALYGNDENTSLATDKKWMVGGVTIFGGSAIQAGVDAGFEMSTEAQTGAACFVVKDVIMTLYYKPSIIIASDNKKLGCVYSAIVMHEKRHVEIGDRVFSMYIPEFRKAIEKYASSLGPQGPYAVGEVKAQQARAIRQIYDSLDPVWQKLGETMRRKQAENDTEAAYMRDTALCPGQFPKYDGSK